MPPCASAGSSGSDFLLAGGLTLALAVPTNAWFAWMGDESFAAAVVAAGLAASPFRQARHGEPAGAPAGD